MMNNRASLAQWGAVVIIPFCPQAVDTSAFWCNRFSDYANQDSDSHYCDHRCLETSSTDEGHVYGTDHYSQESEVCLSAIHAGAPLDSNVGGRVSFIKVPEKIRSVVGSVRNGVVSKSGFATSVFHFSLDSKGFDVQSCPNGRICDRNSKCANQSEICDGIKDCSDNSDEMKCVGERNFTEQSIVGQKLSTENRCFNTSFITLPIIIILVILLVIIIITVWKKFIARPPVAVNNARRQQNDQPQDSAANRVVFVAGDEEYLRPIMPNQPVQQMGEDAGPPMRRPPPLPVEEGIFSPSQAVEEEPLYEEVNPQLCVPAPLYDDAHPSTHSLPPSPMEEGIYPPPQAVEEEPLYEEVNPQLCVPAPLYDDVHPSTHSLPPPMEERIHPPPQVVEEDYEYEEIDTLICIPPPPLYDEVHPSTHNLPPPMEEGIHPPPQVVEEDHEYEEIDTLICIPPPPLYDDVHPPTHSLPPQPVE